jgi:hypothetical protein
MDTQTAYPYLDHFWERIEESDRFHMQIGKVHQTLHHLVADLQAAGIDYAVVGGMALIAHGYLRETVDVDVLVRPDGLASFRDRFVGLGYRPTFTGANKSFVNTQTGVKVEFLTTGEYPGDGKPKPFAFPDPATHFIEVKGARIVDLPMLINLKLASGMTNPGRLRDLADAQELIRVLNLPAEFAGQLNPYVREKFLELRSFIQASTVEG